MSYRSPPPQGWYIPKSEPQAGHAAVLRALQRLDTPFAIVRTEEGPAVATGGLTTLGGPAPSPEALPLLAHVPALTPDRLGDPSFLTDYGVRVPYIAGEMANGIGSAEIVIAMAHAGMIGFFGAAGLSTTRIAAAIQRIQREVGTLPYGFNLIHSPQEPQQEQATVDLYLSRGVRVVCAAAYLSLTPMIVQYRVAGLSRDHDGKLLIGNRLLAKVSREEVAIQFLRPAPEKILRALVDQGRITPEQARIAEKVPMADDITAEADSGGHTDNRPSLVLLPLMFQLRDRIQREMNYTVPVRVGAAGGIATPTAVAAAFAAGAAYVVTGSVNQACVEAGTSTLVKRLLAEAGAADIDMAPASDMFEQGVKVQVLKRGTMFSRRAEQLYTLWREYPSIEAIPTADLQKLETQVFRQPIATIWQECERFFDERDPAQLDRARRDPKHQMALIFRWYLGMSSRWAIHGDESRKLDTQIWCGPAIGAFNAWTQGTFLAEPQHRKAAVVAANLLAGGAAVLRARLLSFQGVNPGLEALFWVPRPVTSLSANA